MTNTTAALPLDQSEDAKKVARIDTLEFSELLSVVIGMNETGGSHYLRARQELVAHIDAQLACQRQAAPHAQAEPAANEVLRECFTWLAEHEKSLVSGRPFIWNALQCNDLQWRLHGLLAAPVPQEAEQAAPAAQSEEILSLHRQLAGERLRADQGWKRAEAKSLECLELRDRMAAPAAVMDLEALPLHYLEGVENGGYFLATDVIRWNMLRQPVAPAVTDDLAKKAARYDYLRATTTAIRNPETGERIECSPEEFEAAIDAKLKFQPAAPAVTGDDIHALRRLIECAEKLNERPRPMCRDCADEDRTCPNSGLECDMRKLFASAKALHNKLAAPAVTDAARDVLADDRYLNDDCDAPMKDGACTDCGWGPCRRTQEKE